MLHHRCNLRRRLPLAARAPLLCFATCFAPSIVPDPSFL